jgi:hypothetical protein
MLLDPSNLCARDAIDVAAKHGRWDVAAKRGCWLRAGKLGSPGSGSRIG